MKARPCLGEGDMSSLTAEEDQKWVPTHVQVTVLRGRGLRGKGKHGTSDVYTIIQLGKEKYSTGVAEKTTEPEWREECSFELQPGGLLEGGHPAGTTELVLMVMHRALIGLDVFLGQAVIQLDKVFQESRCVKNEWYRLNSKTGKKEKERGDIQVTIQFTQNNLTASMYDLIMKDKGASTFSKLKERMRGKRRSSEDDSSSSVLQTGHGSLYRMRQRLPSDGGGEEDYEDDEGGEVRRSKMRTFFLRGKLRKSSDTRSSTSLGSESSESSSRGGSLSPTAGISVVVSDLSNSPSNSSNFTADNSPEHTTNTSPQSSSLKCEFGHEAGEVTITVHQPAFCINGSHADNIQFQDRGLGNPAGSLGLGLLQKSLPLSVSLQNLGTSPHNLPKGLVGDGRRWSFDRPDKEEKAAIAAALEKSGSMQGEKEERLELKAAYMSSTSKEESESLGRKQRKNLFSHGRSESGGKGPSQWKDESEQVCAASQEKHKGWFGSKDPHSKPSLVVFTKVEPNTDPISPPFSPSHYPLGYLVDSASVVSTLRHTNPFCHSPAAPLPAPHCNPFYSLQPHNPFCEDTLTTQLLKTSPPPLPYLSSSRPPIIQHFPQAGNPNPFLILNDIAVKGVNTDTDLNSKVTSKVVERPFPSSPMEGKEPPHQKSSNPFISEPDSEWDKSFDAFAACRLQSTEDLTAESRTQQNAVSDHPLEHYNNKSELWPVINADENTNINDSLYHQPEGTFLFEMSTAPNLLKYNNTYHHDTFQHFLETIPEQRSFESDDITLNTPSNSPNLSTRTETEQDGNATHGLTDTIITPASIHILAAQLDSNSPDPSTSGLGSSAEDDGLSCFSCQSDKFSASSSEAESNTVHFEKSVLVQNINSETEDIVADRSDDLRLIDVSQQMITKHEDDWKKINLNSSEVSLTPQMPTLRPATAKQETESEDSQTPNTSSMYPDLLMQPFESKLKSFILSDNKNKEQSTVSMIDFSENFDYLIKDTRDVMIPASPFDDLFSTPPSSHITTSPAAKHDLLDASFKNTVLGEPETNVPFIYFDDFIDIRLNENNLHQVFDSNFSQAQTFDQGSSSFLQSLHVSSNLQDCQTCYSHPSSKVFGVLEQDEPLHPANSTTCEDLSDIKTNSGVALAPEDSKNEFSEFEGEISQTYGFRDSLHCAQDKMENLVTSLTFKDGLQIQPAPLPFLDMNCNPKDNGEAENQHGALAEMFSNCAQGQDATLHRSQSEGALTLTFDKIFLPSFGSDPGATQGSFSAQLDPIFPSPTSFVPPLTPESNSIPVALCALSPLANISVTMPLSPAQGIAPKPTLDETEQQLEAATQQCSPHLVKPLNTATHTEEKRSVLATSLEKLKSTIHPGRGSQITDQETDRRKSLTEGAGSYYHLTHSELIALLVQREVELERQKVEFDRQKLLLAKREVELKKLKPQVKDLEDYIDTLLVRIMEQKPTLLQVRPKFK